MSEERHRLSDAEISAFHQKLAAFRDGLTASEQAYLEPLLQEFNVEDTGTMHDEMAARPGWTRIGSVAIDSGCLIISDPANSQDVTDGLYADLNAGRYGLHGSIANEYVEIGVYLQTGLGDGGYPVYVQLVDHPYRPGFSAVRRALVEFF